MYKIKKAEWIDIWKKEPPRNKEIFFMTGNGDIHHGEIFDEEKLKKCSFHSFSQKDDFECDSQTPIEERVLYWFPIPEIPKHKKFKDIKCPQNYT